MITKILNKQNVEVKIDNRLQIYNMRRLKKIIDPENSKFKNDKSIKEHSLEKENDPLSENFENEKINQCKKANQLIKKFN